jgi:hypothetical protein
MASKKNSEDNASSSPNSTDCDRSLPAPLAVDPDEDGSLRSILFGGK